MIFRCSPRSIFPSCPSASVVRREVDPLDDLALLDAAMPSAQLLSSRQATPDLERVIGGPERQAPADLPLFGALRADDEPLITKASPPRPPLAVRRATPEVIKPRAMQARTPMLDLGSPDPGAASRSAPKVAPHPGEGPVGADGEAAGLFARLTASAIDLIILAAIDLMVIYFTMQICGLDWAGLKILPKGPLVAFSARPEPRLSRGVHGRRADAGEDGRRHQDRIGGPELVARSSSLDRADARLARSRRSRRIGIPDGAVQPRPPGLARPLCRHARRPRFHLMLRSERGERRLC